MRAKAIAIDPGSTTGVALLSGRDDLIFTFAVPTHDGDPSLLVKLMMDTQPEVVIIERFLTTGKLSRYGIETLELIGVVKCLYYLSISGRAGVGWIAPFELIRRTPSQRATRIPQARALLTERKQIYKQKFEDHEMDALAHLLGWMQAKEPMQPLAGHKDATAIATYHVLGVSH